MDDSAMSMPTLLGEMKFGPAAFAHPRIEVNAQIDQPINDGWALFNHKRDGIKVAKTVTGDERIINVGLDAVVFVKNRCDPTLRIVARAFQGGFFTDHCDRQVVGQMQGQRQASGTAANNHDVVMCLHALVHLPA
jgi:hypothetical protein